ncbi:MAG TPA: GNAT family N-acetyltransferase [Chitinophagaceae bacterium]|nr:GNAT family N-acetyltransferase [Chitinophagaceae bacterium]
MKNSMPNIISKVSTQKEIQFLDDMIYEHSATKTNRDDGKLFSKLIYDSENNIIAGITGWTWASACEITLFWVKYDYRKKGYGQILLNAAEAEAKKEKCKTIFLRTYSFQAPQFYQKYGYKVEHEIKDFPYGHSSFYLIKRLEE